MLLTNNNNQRNSLFVGVLLSLEDLGDDLLLLDKESTGDALLQDIC